MQHAEFSSFTLNQFFFVRDCFDYFEMRSSISPEISIGMSADTAATSRRATVLSRECSRPGPAAGVYGKNERPVRNAARGVHLP
jgi:hypothetical protein